MVVQKIEKSVNLTLIKVFGTNVENEMNERTGWQNEKNCMSARTIKIVLHLMCCTFEIIVMFYKLTFNNNLFMFSTVCICLQPCLIEIVYLWQSAWKLILMNMYTVILSCWKFHTWMRTHDGFKFKNNVLLKLKVAKFSLIFLCHISCWLDSTNLHCFLIVKPPTMVQN